jgi:hypothetical protein
MTVVMCDACRCFVRLGDEHCPFCGAAAPRHAPEVKWLRRGAALVAGTLVAACNSGAVYGAPVTTGGGGETTTTSMPTTTMATSTTTTTGAGAMTGSGGEGGEGVGGLGGAGGAGGQGGR